MMKYMKAELKLEPCKGRCLKWKMSKMTTNRISEAFSRWGKSSLLFGSGLHPLIESDLAVGQESKRQLKDTIEGKMKRKK